MEELRSEDLEELVQELAEEYGAPEPPPPEVEKLLRDLRSGRDGQARREAAEQLGKLDASNPRIVQALITAGKSDSSLGVREAAMESLRAPVHQEYVRRHPDLLEAEERASQQDDLQTETREYVEYRRVKPDRIRKILLVIPAAIVVAGIGLANVSDSSGWWLLILGAILLAGWALWQFMAQESYHNVFTRSMKETVVVVDRVYTERHEKKDSDYGNDVFYKHFVVVCLPPDDKFDPGCDYHLILQVSEEIWFPLDCGSKVRIRYAAEDPRIALIEGEW